MTLSLTEKALQRCLAEGKMSMVATSTASSEAGVIDVKAKSKSTPKAKSKGKNHGLTGEDRYDYDRAQGPDLRDVRCQGSSSMPRSSSTSTSRKRIADGEQCMGSLGGMRTLPAPFNLRANVGIHGTAQGCRPVGLRCGGDFEEQSRGTSDRALHGEGGHRWCGEVPLEQAEDGAGQDAGYGIQEPAGGNFDGRAEEDAEERARGNGRGGRGSDGAEHLRAVGRRDGRGDSLK